VLVSSFVPSSAYARLRADAREGRDGTTVGTITHGDDSPVVCLCQRPRLAGMARPAWLCARGKAWCPSIRL
jgi:hypothetical protein